ncbi:MAG: hypothetical protein LGB01_04365 [Sulfurovum sp.]|nr:hypothetical protein [Sulfurovum sp.]
MNTISISGYSETYHKLDSFDVVEVVDKTPSSKGMFLDKKYHDCRRTFKPKGDKKIRLLKSFVKLVKIYLF